jgi:ribose transport system ATP-binding protein
MALSDRILVLREGQPTALLDKSEFSPDLIMDYASPGGAVQEGLRTGPWNVSEKMA